MHGDDEFPPAFSPASSAFYSLSFDDDDDVCL